MGPNEVRMSWLDATTLTTSLGLGVLAYAFSAFAVAAGLDGGARRVASATVTVER